MDEERDQNVKVFNAAKLYAEKILYRFLEDYVKFQRQANFGHENLALAAELPEEMREIQRFNGLKGMAVTINCLLQAIFSTILSKGNKTEIAKTKEFLDLTENTINKITDNREEFFDTVYKNSMSVEVLNKVFFNKIKHILEPCCVNTMVLMNRNKILFDSTSDDFKTDEELIDQIKKDFVGE